MYQIFGGIRRVSFGVLLTVKNKAMEQLSREDYARLSSTERNEYLRKLYGEHDSDSSRVSDSDDEDWIPANRARHQTQSNKTREQYSTVFGFHEKVTMCSYDPKKNKAVILISTMHSDISVGDDAKRKPELINFYKKYKAGVDTMDKMVRRYTSQQRSSRWPMAMFFNMLDTSSLAAYIIYYENNKITVKKTTERRQFMRKLSEELALPMIEHRRANPQVMRHFSTKIAIENVLGHILTETVVINPGPETPKDKTGRKKVTGSCHVCNALPIRRRRKTRKACANCPQPVCDEHSVNRVQCVQCH
nr:uncharacterized protein LOC106623819 [Bactrocera oleae]